MVILNIQSLPHFSSCKASSLNSLSAYYTSARCKFVSAAERYSAIGNIRGRERYCRGSQNPHRTSAKDIFVETVSHVKQNWKFIDLYRAAECGQSARSFAGSEAGGAFDEASTRLRLDDDDLEVILPHFQRVAISGEDTSGVRGQVDTWFSETF